jgi:2-oxo-4-hydroxy-4-carboxy-5-ureidoimidazoline decarboxylase
VTLEELNALSPERAMHTFRSCCGAGRWVMAMVNGMPYSSRDAVFVAADAIWAKLGPDDWREAFTHHPRIGERPRVATQGTLAAQWSAGEQQNVSSADAAMRAELDAVNREYEARFGFICIVCATGRSAGELLAFARERLQNSPETELRVAAEEQRKITKLRLEKLLPHNP